METIAEMSEHSFREQVKDKIEETKQTLETQPFDPKAPLDLMGPPSRR